MINKEQLIAVETYCSIYKIDFSIIEKIRQTTIINFSIIEDKLFVDADELPELEKVLTFYYDLDINLEGIETINHILQQLHRLKEENRQLRNKLRFYEEDDFS